MASAEFPATVETYLLEVFTEGNPQASIPPVEHLTGHEGVEDGRAHQRHAEVEAEEPPVLHVLVKLSSEEKGRGAWDVSRLCSTLPMPPFVLTDAVTCSLFDSKKELALCSIFTFIF